MTEPSTRTSDPVPREREFSFLTGVNLILRRRHLIAVFAGTGTVLGLLSGLLSTKRYSSEALFLPQTNDASLSGLALAATQFGVRVPATPSAGWGPPVYVEVLQSPTLLGSIALDSVRVVEEGGRQAMVGELLDPSLPDGPQRREEAIIALNRSLSIRDDKLLNAVRVKVTTRWPSVSFAIAERLVQGASQFNLEIRKSQATAEREFVGNQISMARSALRQAEDNLQTFLQRNRSTANSPELLFQQDRLQREVGVRQQLLTTLLQSYEEARIREVRDTPVLTMLESPQVPTLREPRRSVLKAILGLMAGGLLGVLVSAILSGLRVARDNPDDDSREFFALVNDIAPRLSRRLIQ